MATWWSTKWGAFTSVAGETGEAVQWAPLVETPGLPCFVERLSPQSIEAANALVRMETPVRITEWYPHATAVQPKPFGMPMILAYKDGTISWDEIHLSPCPDPQYPMGKGASRYYAARRTDSSPRFR